MRSRHAVPLGLLAAGAAGLVYATVIETRSFRLRRVEIPVLAPGQPPLRILHLSDIHMVPGQRAKQAWLRSLDLYAPDLVVNTGDNLSHPDAVPAVLDGLGPLLRRPGVFVFGSNDYFVSRLKNPAGYLLPDDGKRPGETAPMNPWEPMRDAFLDAGWLDLTNVRDRLKVDGRELEFVGVDDPHIHRDRYDDVAGTADPAADLSLGVVHAPYTHVLDRMTADSLPLILAGHTHGGQLRIPFYGALVTNCDLDRSRARGLSRWGGTERGLDAESWLQVSAGIGASRFAPYRFACPPEAILITLTPTA